VWFLWAVNAAVDLVQQGAPSPFTVVMLAALLGGHALVWLGVSPDPMPRAWAIRTYRIVGVVVVVFAAYVLLRIVTPL